MQAKGNRLENFTGIEMRKITTAMPALWVAMLQVFGHVCSRSALMRAKMLALLLLGP